MADPVTTNPTFGRGRGRGRGFRSATTTKPGPPPTVVSSANDNATSAKPGPAPTVVSSANGNATSANGNATSANGNATSAKPVPLPTQTVTKSSDSVIDDSASKSSIENGTSQKKETRTISANINDLIKRMDNLTTSEITKKILPDIELITDKKAIEDLVHALSVKAISDPLFGAIAAKISSEVWNNKSMHSLIRNPLLKQAQEDYKKRDDTRKKNQFYGLLVYICELFNNLRVMGKPLNFLGDAVVQLLKELVQKKEKQTDDDIFYFYQELESVGFLLEECLPEKMEEIINITRQMVISATLVPSMRCRLVQLIELHASKWKMPDDLKVVYEDMQQDLMSAGQ